MPKPKPQNTAEGVDWFTKFVAGVFGGLFAIMLGLAWWIDVEPRLITSYQHPDAPTTYNRCR